MAGSAGMMTPMAPDITSGSSCTTLSMIGQGARMSWLRGSTRGGRRHGARGLILAAASSSSAAAADASSYERNSDRINSIERSTTRQHAQPIVRSDEPYLYEIPTELYPTYRPIPVFIKVLIGLASTMLSTVWTFRKEIHHWTNRLVATTTMGSGEAIGIIGDIKAGGIKKMVLFLARAVVTALASTIFVQDLFRAPSRISTLALTKKYWLPSSLSRYDVIQPKLPPDCGDVSVNPLGVHYLQYTTPQSTNVKFDALHFNHGFGASSLSWLPAIPPLVSKLNGRMGLAHDAVGFGFTDRPSPRKKGGGGGLAAYSPAMSAGIGTKLLEGALARNVDTSSTSTDRGSRGEDEENSTSTPTLRGNKEEHDENEEDVGQEGNIFREDEEAKDESTTPPTVALFGHSMGCVATLRMALNLPHDAKRFVILTAPALSGEPPSSSSSSNAALTLSEKTSKSVKELPLIHPRRLRGYIFTFVALLRRVVLDLPLRYALRRAVAGKDFWRKGLSLAWGDPNRLSDSDVLRFQWPSIGRGWEKGLLSFTRSRIAGKCEYPGGDLQLLKDVLALPNTSVAIIYGTKDNIVTSKMIDKIKSEFPDLKFVTLDGLGHDPFEEQVDTFVATVEGLLEKDTVVFA